MSADVDSLHQTVRSLVRELEDARFAGVPTYAPKAFSSALERYERVRQMFASLETAYDIEREAANAFDDLATARATAEKTEPLLSRVVRARTTINKIDQVRYRSAEKLAEAERAYRQATEQAEAGDVEAAQTSAGHALEVYRDARLTALQGGLIRNLRSQFQYAAYLLEPEAHDDASAILSSLDREFDQALNGDLDAELLTARIAAADREIGSIFLRRGLRPGLNIDLSEGMLFDPGPPGWAPGTFGPPTAPLTMRIIDRTDSTLTVRWRNIESSADANILERREGDGPWEVVAELGVEGEWQTHTDGVGLGLGLTPDQHYCYRVRATNAYGSSMPTPSDNRACGHTRDGNDLTLGRIQLRIRIADIPNGGSGDPVRVRLSSPLVTHSPSGNGTWLDYGPEFLYSGGYVIVVDDFARGRDFTYDLNLTYLKELSDITMISILKEGDDQLAIAELALIVNGVEVFHRLFGETKSTAQLVGNGSPIYTIYHTELRAHSAWPTSFPTPSLQITNQELVERLEGIIGDQIHGLDVHWGQQDGGDWVRLSRLNDTAMHATVDLEAAVPGPDLEVNVEFDVTFAIVCSEAKATLNLTTSNFDSDVNFDILHDILSLGVVEFFDDNIERAIKAAWEPIEKSFDVPTGGLCPTVRVDQDGNLNFIPA